MNIKFSIIVPAFNIESYIDKCLSSIELQVYKNFEVIVVDDGSVDKTADVAQVYVARDSRFLLVRQKNMGLSAARNYGISISSGEYVVFIDGDDFIPSDLLEKIACSCSVWAADIIVFGLKFLKNDKICKREIYLPESERIGSHYLLESLRVDKFSPTVCNKVFSRRLIDGLIFPQGLNNEDIFFTIIALLKAKKVVCVNDSYYFYRKNRIGSITSKISPKSVDDLSEIFCQTFSYMKRNRYDYILENKYFKYEFSERIFKEILIKLSDKTSIDDKISIIKRINDIQMFGKHIEFYIKRGRSVSIRIAFLLFKLNPFFYIFILRNFFYIKNFLLEGVTKELSG